MKKYKVISHYEYVAEVIIEAQEEQEALERGREILQDMPAEKRYNLGETETEVFEVEADGITAEEKPQGQVIETVYKITEAKDVMIINNLCEISEMWIEKVGQKSTTMRLKPSRTFSFLEAGEYKVCFLTESDSIQPAAFLECTALTSVVIPKGIVSIDMSAFALCTALQSIVIPEGVTTIGVEVFGGCKALTSVSLPSTLTTIGYSAFYDCSALESITLPSILTKIGDNAFYNCTALTSIEIPEGVTSIGGGTFWYCTALTSITIPEGVTSIGNVAFQYCTALQSINIPEGVTEIGGYAFYGCGALASVSLPSTLKAIGAGAFYTCTSLSSITCKATAAPTLDEQAFRHVEKGGCLRIPKGATGYEAWMEQLADDIKVIEI